jgi:hypothetical protein
MTHKFQIPLLATLLIFTASCTKFETAVAGPPLDANIVNQIKALPAEVLSSYEINSLLHMREEEKLARDVYTVLYQQWNSRVFGNIKGSEQTHTDAVLTLIEKYQLQDPVQQNPEGVFVNKDLQALYHTLVAKGSKSIVDAFEVGATIEDLDLFDLQKDLDSCDNADIQFVYGNLARGSRNHMRAFYRNLTNVGGTYTPQFISKEKFDTIIRGSQETGW